MKYPYFEIFDSLKRRRRPVGISATPKITDPKFTIARANFVPSPCQIELPALWQGRAVPYVEGWGANATLSRPDRENHRVDGKRDVLCGFLMKSFFSVAAGGGFMRAVITKGRLCCCVGARRSSGTFISIGSLIEGSRRICLWGFDCCLYWSL